MLLSAFAQLRLAASVALGIPFAQWSLDQLVEAARDTQREFGGVGAEAGDLLGGPALDEATRREMQLRRFRSQAARAARETAYYAPVFERLGLDPTRLRHEDLPRIPPTPKEALRGDPDAFVRRGARPAFRTTTTGTTGRPTCVSFSDREMRAYAALTALTHLARGRLREDDVVQLSSSARATLGNTCFAGACQRIGAQWYLAGVIEPERALALLTEERRLPGKKRRTSVLSTYPSYLGELAECARTLGYRPTDFGLERVFVGGEVVTAGLKERAREVFGDVAFEEGYATTETWPLGGARCSQGHLHYDAAQALVEVLSLERDGPAAPGEPGTVVATPFPPFRETTILLRYDTEDVVRPLAADLTCSLRNLPGTTDLLGKRRLSVRHDGGWTFVRDVAEALESLPEVPLPARYGFWAVPGGVAVEVAVTSDTRATQRAVERRLEDADVPVRWLRLVEDRRQLLHPLPLRCDLREAAFAETPAPGAGSAPPGPPVVDDARGAGPAPSAAPAHRA